MRTCYSAPSRMISSSSGEAQVAAFAGSTPTAERFGLRLIVVFGLAFLAYLVALQFFFPGYIAPPVPYHPDMYWSVNFVAQGLNAATFFSWPRPLFYETLFLAGHFGLVGALLFLDAIVLFDLALAIVLFERLVLYRKIPWIVALGTLILAMAGPGFYSQPGYDVGFHVALLFGLLGVYVWELRMQRHRIAALCLLGLFFALSALTNEGLIPALVIYGAYAAFRNRGSPAIAIALAALPFVAVAVSLGDSHLTHSPFIRIGVGRIGVGATYPYRIDLAPSSLLLCARFYLASLVNPGFLVLAAVAGFAIWLRQRLVVAAMLLAAALSLYLPYCVLPNHLDVTYQWVPMPLLMLLVPLAWVGPAKNTRLGLRADLVSRVGLAVALLFAIGFQSTQARDQKHWYESALAQNRAVLTGLRSLKPRISAAHSVLVCGLGFGRWPFMQSAVFLSRELDFRGEWTVTNEPGFAPIAYQANARPIDYSKIRWADYDLVVIFDRDGRARAYDRRQFRMRTARLESRHLSSRGLIDLMQLYYPPGILAPASWAAGARQGIYLDTSPALCCFLNAKPSLQFDKPFGARIVVFTFDVPRTAPFAHRPERIEISFNGLTAGPPVVLSEGTHRVSFRLSPSLARSHHLVVAMRMSVAYIPKQLGINDDVRQLSIKLLRVDYRP